MINKYLKRILPYDASITHLIFLSLRATVGSAAIPVVGAPLGIVEPVPSVSEEYIVSPTPYSEVVVKGSFRGAPAPLKKLSSPFPLLRGRGTKGDRVT